MKKLLAFLFLLVASPALAGGYLPLFALPIPNFTLNGGFPNWKACRAAVRNNASDCKILFIGDSNLTGEGGLYNDTASDAHSVAIPNQLALMLRTLGGINAQVLSVTGNNSTGSYGAFNTKVVQNGWSSVSPNSTLGGFEWLATNTTAFTFNPTDVASYPSLPAIQTDTLDVYWNGTAAGNGTLTVDTGGAAICSINTNTGSNQFNKTTCSTTLGANTYNLKCSSPSTCVWGTIVARNSAVKQVSVLNGAAAGATLAVFTNNTGSPWDPLAQIATLAPSLCIISEIANNASAQTSISAYTTDLTAIVNACKQSGAGDVLLLTAFPLSGDSSPITVEQYQAAVISVATSANVPVWDTMTLYNGVIPGWTQTGMAEGWNGSCCGTAANGTHWSIGNNVFVGTMISLMLLQ